MLYCDKGSGSTPLSLDDYQQQARRSDQNRRHGASGLQVPLLGLFGEVGSLLTQPKRRDREKATYSPYDEAITEELGDVLWYLSNLASRHRIHLSSLAQSTRSLHEIGFPDRPLANLTFSQVQRRKSAALKASPIGDAEFFALGGAVGRLMSEFAAGEEWGLDRQQFLRHLVQSFRLLVAAAAKSDVSLNFAAQNNLAKIQSRWPAVKVSTPLFDTGFEKEEQLPRRIVVRFVERKVAGRMFVFQSCRGINVGDRLTDNKSQADDYRFHDVFHLGYAAILGWSPVIRALFQLKRKSRPDIDENQDGARAILIEEGIASWIFNHGLRHKNFRYVRRLDYPLLKTIRQFVSGYEVERVALWEWEKAILQGFQVFRALKAERQGWVIADLHRRTLSYRSTPPRRTSGSAS